jgi:glutaredoxin 3
MTFFRGRSAAITAALFLLLSNAEAFLKSSTSNVAFSRVSQTSSTTQIGAFDFLKEGKKALVKKLAGDYDAAAVRARLDGLIADNKVLMLSFTTWPFCVKAKAVLDAKGTKYTAVELDTDPEGKAIRAEMGELLGRTSVPAMWIDSTFLGGFNDGPTGGLNKLDESGELAKMLSAAGAI